MRDEYRIVQDGMPVAWSTNLKDALHYAAVYSQDGAVELQERHNGRWRKVKQENSDAD